MDYLEINLSHEMDPLHFTFFFFFFIGVEKSLYISLGNEENLNPN